MGGYTNVLNLYLRKLYIYCVNNTLQASVGRHRNIMKVDNKNINLEPEIKK